MPSPAPAPAPAPVEEEVLETRIADERGALEATATANGDHVAIRYVLRNRTPDLLLVFDVHARPRGESRPSRG